MNKAMRRKITEKITELLNEAGVLRPNQTAKVTIAIVDVPQVTVEMGEREDDAKYLNELVERMPSKSVRMKNVIEYCSLTLSIIKSKSLYEMLKYRNLGRLTLIELKSVFLSEGIDCLWMNELAAEELDRLPIDQLELSIRSENTLRNAGFETVGDFRRKTVGELTARPFRNFGRRTIREIHEKMLNRGMNLGWIK